VAVNHHSVAASNDVQCKMHCIYWTDAKGLLWWSRLLLTTPVT